jgi:NAD dependent epimerase/dehydratase family enzyme
MRVVIAGAGGLIGTNVARDLESNGHEVFRLVRHEPGAGEVRWDPDGGMIDRDHLEDFDAAVDVATMPWSTRWTSAAKKRIYANRVGSYRLLAGALGGRARKPKVLVCASGHGIYPGSSRPATSSAIRSSRPRFATSSGPRRDAETRFQVRWSRANAHAIGERG